MAAAQGTIYTVHVIEASPTAAGLNLMSVNRANFTYMTGEVVADVTNIKKAERDPRGNFLTDGWIVSFRLLNGSTVITGATTLTQLIDLCQEAIETAHSTEITAD